MSLYQDIEDGIIARLQNDSWFYAKQAWRLKTVTTDLPDTATPVLDWTEMFSDSCLPALVVLSAVEAATHGSETVGEIRHEVPVKILGVWLGRTRATARNSAQELAAQLERVLLQCRMSAAALPLAGAGNFITRINTVVDVRPAMAARRFYGLMECDATVVVIRNNA